MLGNVATFPEYRMTGLGQACVDAVMAWFREETAVTSVELFATDEGRRRYVGHGFVDHPIAHLRVPIPRGDR
jgi:GNAT superfamily N-acetyltransferase